MSLYVLTSRCLSRTSCYTYNRGIVVTARARRLQEGRRVFGSRSSVRVADHSRRVLLLGVKRPATVGGFSFSVYDGVATVGRFSFSVCNGVAS